MEGLGSFSERRRGRSAHLPVHLRALLTDNEDPEFFKGSFWLPLIGGSSQGTFASPTDPAAPFVPGPRFARLSFEASDANPSALAHGTPLLATPPALPPIAVRIGDVTPPDDGVIGAFIPGATAAAGRFAPVSAEAPSKAIFNGLAYNTIYELGKPLPIGHEFILPHEVEVTLTAGQPQDVILLTDVRGGLFATSGVLPRKHLRLPKEFLDAALTQMEPTFRVGPVLTFARQGSLRVMVPPPSIDKYTGAFVHEDFEEDAASPEFVETPIPATPPLADLPVNRVTLREGWVRVVKHEP